jgi:hypothetical protein
VYVAGQRLGKIFAAATNTRATTVELLNTSSSVRSVSYQRRFCGSVYFPIVARQPLGKLRGNEELLDVSFSMRSVSYQRKVGD